MNCWIKKQAIIIPLIGALTGCIEEDAVERLYAGYSDGYSVGHRSKAFLL